MADYVMTIDSDSEEHPSSTRFGADDFSLNPEFTFDVSGDPYVDLVRHTELAGLVEKGRNQVRKNIEYVAECEHLGSRIQYPLTTS